MTRERRLDVLKSRHGAAWALVKIAVKFRDPSDVVNIVKKWVTGVFVRRTAIFGVNWLVS
jgi:hypothetical protein